MAGEIDDLRAHTKKLASENENLKARIKKAMDYLELIESDRTKTNGELAIIEVTMDCLREEIV
jgi:hypothetical protein